MNLPVYETDEAIRLTEEAVDGYHGALDGLVSAWAMPFSSEFCSPELLAATHAIAESRETRSTLHFTNGARWIQHCREEHDCTPTEYLDRHGVLTPAMTLAHCLGIGDDEARLIGERGAAVVMCPTAAIKGGARMTQQGLLPELLEYGAVVGSWHRRGQQFQPAGNVALRCIWPPCCTRTGAATWGRFRRKRRWSWARLGARRPWGWMT